MSNKTIICLSFCFFFTVISVSAALIIGLDGLIMLAAVLCAIISVCPIIIPIIYRSGKLQKQLDDVKRELDRAHSEIAVLEAKASIPPITISIDDGSTHVKTRRTAEKAEPELPSDYVVIDVETTGLDATDRIVQFSALKVSGDNIIDQLDILINPDMHIPDRVSSIHHITDDMVSTSPKFADIDKMITDFVSDGMIVGYNVSFDMRMLNAELERCGAGIIVNPTYDVMSLAKHSLRLGGYKLTDVCEYFGIDVQNAHNALHDCIATVECYKRLRPFALLSDKEADFFAFGNADWGGRHNKSDQRARRERARECIVESINHPERSGIFSGSNGESYITSLCGCDCTDFVEREKPCKHMYRLIAELGLITKKSGE